MQARVESQIEIQPWNNLLIPWLSKAIEQFFIAGIQRGGDVLPTKKNINAFVNLGLRGASVGDPCLVALINNHPAGYVLWVGTQNPVLDSRWKTINALGSYTERGFRSRGIADKLRLEALRITKALGYERIVGPVHLSNQRGIDTFISDYEAWPTTITFEKFI